MIANPQRVGVDATSWVNRRGFGRFARNAVRQLVELDGDTHYILYIDEASATHAELPAGAEHQLVALDEAPSDAASARSSRSVADLWRLNRAVARDGLDGFLFPSTYTYFPVNVPSVVGLHDATGHNFPALTFPGRRSRILWRAKEAIAIRRAAQLFTVSQASQTVLASRLGLPASRLPIVPEAPDPVFSPRPPAAKAEATAAVGLAPGAPFFLYSGGISPSKNLGTLLDAYAALRASRPRAPLLVVVGELDTEVYVSAAVAVREQIHRLGLGDSVLLPGFVSDETLAGLYSGATAVVNPSLAEGFGLPAVEAARCGAATILSDLPAHRERLGDAALFFPARDSVTLAALLTRVIDEPELVRELSADGQAAVASLSWDAAADVLRGLLNDAVGT